MSGKKAGYSFVRKYRSPRLRPQHGDSRHERMFETRSEAWEAVGLAAEVRQREVRRARTQAIVLLPLLAGVITAYALREQIFGAPADTPVRIAAVLAVVILGWAVARDVGRAAAPTFFRRLDPATAGTVGFLIRLATIAVTLELPGRFAALARKGRRYGLSALAEVGSAPAPVRAVRNGSG